MPLQLDTATQNISTASGDTGTYTWADVFALGSTAITKTGNVYFCAAQVRLASTSTLNITNENIEITGTGYISGKINVTTCRIIISAQYTQPTRYVSLGGDGAISDSCIILRATDQYASFAVNANTFTNCQIFGEDFASAGADVARKINLLAGTSKKIYIKKVKEVVLTLTTSKAEELSLLDVDDGVVNFNTGETINLFEYSPLGTTRLHYKIGQGSFRFVNSPDVTLAKGGVLNPSAPAFGWGGATPTAFQAVAHYLKIIDSTGGVSGASIVYSGYSTASLTSSAGGSVSEIILDIENTNAQNNINDYGQYNSGSISAITTVSTPSYTRTIKSYGHEASSENFVLNKSSSLGSSVSPVSVLLFVDEGVTQLNTATVAAYTGITHTPTTITVSQSRSLNEIYDSRKLYWRNNTGVVPPTKIGDAFDLGGANLVIDGITLSATTKFSTIQTTGSVTFLNGGDATVPIQDSTGTRTSITLTGLVVGSEVRLYLSNGTDFAGVESCVGSTQSFSYTHTTDFLVDIVVFKEDYIPIRLNQILLTSVAQSIQVQQRFDRVYTNS